MNKPKPSKTEQRREAFKGFSKNFERVAKSKWFHEMHQAMNPPRKIKGHSQVGLRKLMRYRGVK